MEHTAQHRKRTEEVGTLFHPSGFKHLPGRKKRLALIAQIELLDEEVLRFLVTIHLEGREADKPTVSFKNLPAIEENMKKNSEEKGSFLVYPHILGALRRGWEKSEKEFEYRVRALLVPLMQRDARELGLWEGEC